MQPNGSSEAGLTAPPAGTHLDAQLQFGGETQIPIHFFFLFSRFGADTFTLPGIFLDKSVSYKTSEMKKMNVQKWIYKHLPPQAMFLSQPA